MSWLSRIWRSRQQRGWQAVPPFRGLTARERKQLEKQFERRTAESGIRVVEEGEVAEELIFVASGSLELFKRDPKTAQEHAIGSVGPNEVFADPSLLDGKLRAASARAATRSELLVLPFAALRRSAARREDSLNKRVYQNLVAGLAESLVGRLRAHVDLSLENARQRAVMGQFIVNVLILVCCYVLFLNALPLFWGHVSNTTETFSLPLIAIFGVASWRFMRKSGYPLSHFGIGFQHLLGSLLEALLFTPLFLILVTGIRALLLWLNASELPVIEHTDLGQRLGEPNVLLWLRIYAATALVQELIVRGALQSSLEAFLTGPGRRTRAIVVCALLFSISHLHLSYLFALVALVPGLFWGWLYSRRPNLAGVSLSHIAVGGYVFFVLGTDV